MSNLSVGNGLEERNRDPTAFRDFEAKGLAAALRHGAGDQGTESVTSRARPMSANCRWGKGRSRGRSRAPSPRGRRPGPRPAAASASVSAASQPQLLRRPAAPRTRTQSRRSAATGWTNGWLARASSGGDPRRARTHQARHHRKRPLAASTAACLNPNTDEPEPPFSKSLISLKSSDDGQAGHEQSGRLRRLSGRK
jgi:hypothetical protein